MTEIEPKLTESYRVSQKIGVSIPLVNMEVGLKIRKHKLETQKGETVERWKEYKFYSINFSERPLRDRLRRFFRNLTRS